MTNHKMKKTVVAVLAAGMLGSAALTGTGTSLPTASAAQTAVKQDSIGTKLNSFYKPALKGQFPDLNGFTLGETSRQAVVKAMGEPTTVRGDADGYDLYHAEMGHPGYAFNYKLNKLREMRYFGTNVERQTNIGGFTVKLLVSQWGAPNSSVIIKNGKLTQKKITYVRGDYQLEFIFNNTNGTNCDHINLKAKTVK